jgi:hypothetical protein
MKTAVMAATLTLLALGNGASAAPLAGQAPVGSASLVANAQYIDGYNRHRHHHGHVHGNPHRTHLDCRWYGNHEHCQIHKPRRYHSHQARASPPLPRTAAV